MRIVYAPIAGGGGSAQLGSQAVMRMKVEDIYGETATLEQFIGVAAAQTAEGVSLRKRGFNCDTETIALADFIVTCARAY